MKDMKLTKSERKESEPCEIEKPEYPWGLRIDLGNEACDKLKIKVQDGA